MSLPNQDGLLAAMKRIADVLSHAEVPFALAGGLAVHARGGTRSEHDVDFVIREEDVDRALHAIDGAGYRTERPPEGWLVKAYDGDNLVDLIFRPVGRPVTDETLAETDVLPIAAITVPVLSATELLIHALLRLSAHACDLAPGLALVRSLREQINVERVRTQTKHSAYARAFMYLAVELDLLAPADRVR